MPGVVLHPQPCVRMEKAHKLKSPQVKPKHRHSLRDGLTAYSALSPETRLCCLRRLHIIDCKLDASLGVSGPHVLILVWLARACTG